MLVQKLDNKGIATFSMKDESTKKSFVDELDEYIREVKVAYKKKQTRVAVSLKFLLKMWKVYDPFLKRQSWILYTTK